MYSIPVKTLHKIAALSQQPNWMLLYCIYI